MTTKEATSRADSKPIDNRYEFSILFDVTNGNPNGDPDNGNQPRQDPESLRGWVTDVCLKRKIRDWVMIRHEDRAPFGIYIAQQAVLSLVRADVAKANGLAVAEVKDEGGESDEGPSPDVAAQPATSTKEGRRSAKPKAAPRSTADEAKVLQKLMLDKFWDIRAFGAVMAGKLANAGKVRGPVQLGFAESMDPITIAELTVHRCAVETPKEAEDQRGENHTMGKKYIVPYGLYRVNGHVSAAFARQTGFVEQDLDLLWEAILGMFEHDQVVLHLHHSGFQVHHFGAGLSSMPNRSSWTGWRGAAGLSGGRTQDRRSS